MYRVFLTSTVWTMNELYASLIKYYITSKIPWNVFSDRDRQQRPTLKFPTTIQTIFP